MKWIRKCIDSLLASSTPVSIIIIDNGSKDETVDFIRHTYEQITLIRSRKNLGFGQANNIGIRLAIDNGATHVLLLNQDAWIDKTMLNLLLPWDDGHTILSPVHLNGQGTAIDKNFLTNAVVRSNYNQLRERDNLLMNAKGIHPAHEICAACWLVPRNILLSIGGFSPLFFHYCEDVNYQHRLIYHNMKIAWVGGTYVYHDREFRPRKQATYISIRQELILRATNINQTTLRTIYEQYRYGLGVIHTAITYKEWKSIAYLVKASINLLFQFRHSIKDSRIRETKSGRTWL